MSAIGPCAFPNCKDLDGSPRLTRYVICDACRGRFRRLIGWVLEDYIEMVALFPTPVVVGPKGRSAGTKEFGHPAEFASDVARDIAALLNSIEDDLRWELDLGNAVPETVRENERVRAAADFLAARFDELCESNGAGRAASRLWDLHRSVRSALGRNERLTRLPTPCPECDMKMLVRVRDGGWEDRVECRFPDCGVQIHPHHYELWSRIVLKERLDAE